MRIVQTYIFCLILITLVCSQFSCGSVEEGTVLYRVLRKLKFRVMDISPIYPAHLDRYDVLFLQDLHTGPTKEEAKEIQDFVNTGGTLIAAEDDRESDNLFEVFDLKLRELPKRQELSWRILDEPFFPGRPVDEIRVLTDFVIEPLAREIAVLYGAEGEAVIVTLRYGEGRAFFITSGYLFSSSGLRNNEGNALLLYNLMSTLPRNARIGLAEWRYYTVESKKSSDPFAALVFGTPGGLGAVYICLTLFVFLMLRGRRFGKPLDVRERNRRLSSEYVHAMTDLYQKGNTRPWILRHIRERFRADLGNRWRVNPNLDTQAFLEELARRGAMDRSEGLTELVMDLELTSNISEARLLDLAKRVETYCETANLRRTRRRNP